jgi:DNA mismatch endonuclease (patch repair protein)
MSRIRGRNTGPEIVVRTILHSLGLRFRLHRRDLPGRPDVVLPRWRTLVFVHGCFWHHHDCSLGYVPKTRTAFWLAKFKGNVERDARSRLLLQAQGWKVITVWECETKDVLRLTRRLHRRFAPGRKA